MMATPFVTPLARRALRLAAAAAAVWAMVAAGAWAQPRYTVSAEGAEVTDQRTGLVWQRCSAGQSYAAGDCAGVATPFTHEQALVHARSHPGWRLPNVKELSSLVDDGRINPAIDSIFPQTPSYYFWTSSPLAGGSDIAWGVYFGHGGVGNLSPRNYNGRVRLVR